MNYLCVYYDGRDGETKSVIVTNESAPYDIPANLVTDGLVLEPGDVHAVIAVPSDNMAVAEGDDGVLFFDCGFDEQAPVPTADRVHQLEEEG